MLMIALLLAAAVQAGPAHPPPNEAAMHAAAARCDLPADWLRFGHDEDGDFADPSNSNGAAPATLENVICFTGWAEQAHARFAFMSEPPPGPQGLAIISDFSGPQVVRAGRQCGLA